MPEMLRKKREIIDWLTRRLPARSLPDRGETASWFGVAKDSIM